jgi:hypothetical protein
LNWHTPDYGNPRNLARQDTQLDNGVPDMAASADVVSEALIEIFESIPEYDAYGDPESIRLSEDAYRIALARLTKTWGDQLLELAESRPTPLTGRDVHTLDALVEKISAVITQLNDLDRSRALAASGPRHCALLEADAAILKALEETSRRMQELYGPRNPSLWIKDNAAPIYRRLRRVGRDVALRNQILRARRQPWRDETSLHA